MASLRERVWAWLDTHPDTIDGVTFAQAAQVLLDHGFKGTALTLSTYIQRWARSRGKAARPPGPKAVVEATCHAEEDDQAPDWEHNPDTDTVHMYGPGWSYTMPGLVVDKLCWWYCNGGVGATQPRVARMLADKYGLELKASDIENMRRSLHITKSSLPKAPHIVATQPVEVLVADILSAKEAKVETRLRVEEERKLRSDNQRLRRILKDRETIVEAITYAARELPPISLPAIQYDHRLEAVRLIVGAFDWHIGASHDWEGHVYNVDVAKRRVYQYLQEVCDHIASFSRPIEHIDVALGGDMVDGVLEMRDGHRLEQDVMAYAQSVAAADLIAWFIQGLRQRAACPISVYAVPGNHGRAGGDRKRDPARVVEQMVYGMASRMLPGVTWHQHHHRLHWVIGKTGVILTHGERDPRKLLNTVRPYRVTHRHIERWLVLCGHRHYPLIEQELDTTLVQSGSPVGFDPYAATQLGLGCRPSQCIVEVGAKGPRPAYSFFLD